MSLMLLFQVSGVGGCSLRREVSGIECWRLDMVRLGGDSMKVGGRDYFCVRIWRVFVEEGMWLWVGCLMIILGGRLGMG